MPFSINSKIMPRAVWLPCADPDIEQILVGPPTSSSSGLNCMRDPDCSWIFFIISPPLPMMTPIKLRGTGTYKKQTIRESRCPNKCYYTIYVFIINKHQTQCKPWWHSKIGNSRGSSSARLLSGCGSCVTIYRSMPTSQRHCTSALVSCRYLSSCLV